MLMPLVMVSGCSKKDPEPDCSQEGYIIGFDQNTAGYTRDMGKGFVIAFTHSPDTVVTYNLPDTLYDFPPELFQAYQFTCFFPEAERKKYKIVLGYRYARKEEKTAVVGTHDKDEYEFSHFVRGREIILQCIRRAD